MIEKYIRGGISKAIHRYTKGNNKYVEDYDKDEESSYVNYWDVSNLYRWTMPQKLAVYGFK